MVFTGGDLQWKLKNFACWWEADIQHLQVQQNCVPGMHRYNLFFSDTDSDALTHAICWHQVLIRYLTTEWVAGWDWMNDELIA